MTEEEMRATKYAVVADKWLLPLDKAAQLLALLMEATVVVDRYDHPVNYRIVKRDRYNSKIGVEVFNHIELMAMQVTSPDQE